ncbi:MAG TPA: response regulator transcription factor, partial [Gaiellaceae bacterium]
ELIARVRAHLRRAEFDRTGSPTTLRRVGGLTVDTIRREVTVDGEPVHLTVSEFQLLALLSERPGEVVSRRQLVSRLWSSEFEGETRTCDAHVRRLRAKIEDDPSKPSRLVTVRGVGYKLVG